MQIIEVKVNDLKEYENNPRINEKAIKPVMNSIQEFGFKVPLVIDKNNVIITGHTRVEAAKRLGLETVPCIIADDLSEEQIKAFRLVDNKTSEYAEWDFMKLEEELREFNEFDFDISLFDFSLSFTEELEEKEEDIPESFDEYDEDIETKHQCPKCGYEWS